MKQVVPHLKLDEKVWAIIEEILEKNGLIVNFQGDLIRVANGSGRRFRPGQRIQLKVYSLRPLGFQLIESKNDGKIYSRHLDIEV